MMFLKETEVFDFRGNSNPFTASLNSTLSLYHLILLWMKKELSISIMDNDDMISFQP